MGDDVSGAVSIGYASGETPDATFRQHIERFRQKEALPAHQELVVHDLAHVLLPILISLTHTQNSNQVAAKPLPAHSVASEQRVATGCAMLMTQSAKPAEPYSINQVLAAPSLYMRTNIALIASAYGEAIETRLLASIEQEKQQTAARGDDTRWRVFFPGYTQSDAYDALALEAGLRRRLHPETPEKMEDFVAHLAPIAAAFQQTVRVMCGREPDKQGLEALVDIPVADFMEMYLSIYRDRQS